MMLVLMPAVTAHVAHVCSPTWHPVHRAPRAAAVLDARLPNGDSEDEQLVGWLSEQPQRFANEGSRGPGGLTTGQEHDASHAEDTLTRAVKLFGGVSSAVAAATKEAANTFAATLSAKLSADADDASRPAGIREVARVPGQRVGDIKSAWTAAASRHAPVVADATSKPMAPPALDGNDWLAEAKRAPAATESRARAKMEAAAQKKAAEAQKAAAASQARALDEAKVAELAKARAEEARARVEEAKARVAQATTGTGSCPASPRSAEVTPEACSEPVTPLAARPPPVAPRVSAPPRGEALHEPPRATRGSEDEDIRVAGNGRRPPPLRPRAAEELAAPPAEATREVLPVQAEPMDAPRAGPVLKVVGVGGGGCNTVSNLPSALGGLLGSSVELLMLNTDTQALHHNARDAARDAAAALEEGEGDEAARGGPSAAAITTVALGEETLHGNGAGGVAANGKAAAVASEAVLRERFADTDLIFITAGMGGGTGSGAAPVVARLAKESGAVTVALVSIPFGFEGSPRAAVAAAAVAELEAHVDVLVVVENERLLALLPAGPTVQEALDVADNVARQAILGVATLIGTSQLINVDLADVRSVMRNAGRGLIAIGRGSGPERADAAVDAALASPLLDLRLEAVRGCAYAVSGGASLTLHEVNHIGLRLASVMADDAQIIFGAAVDLTLPPDEIVLTLIATGMRPPPSPPPVQSPLNIFQYHPPKPLRDDSGQEEAAKEGAPYMRRYADYLDSRVHGVPPPPAPPMSPQPAVVARSPAAVMPRPVAPPPRQGEARRSTSHMPMPSQPSQAPQVSRVSQRAGQNAPVSSPADDTPHPLTPQQQAMARMEQWAQQEAGERWRPKPRADFERWRPKTERRKQATQTSDRVSGRVNPMGPGATNLRPERPPTPSWRSREATARP